MTNENSPERSYILIISETRLSAKSNKTMADKTIDNITNFLRVRYLVDDGLVSN
jgi:hypothetical protein